MKRAPGVVCAVTAVMVAAAVALAGGAASRAEKIKPPPTLFDGKTLAGWDGDRSLWRVEEGQIVGQVKDRLAHNAFLISQHKLRDFRLIVEVKLSDTKNNSGIQFRSEKIKVGEHDSIKGYQADIGGEGGQYWCDLYDEHGRAWLYRDGPPKDAVIPNGWNIYEVVAVGSKIMTALNGKTCLEMDDPKGARAGQIAVQLHSGGPIEVRFRNFDLTLDPKAELKTVATETGRRESTRLTALDPFQAARQMTVPEGFKVSLVASEPDLRQPVAFTFDARGRIWVAEAHSYPQRRPDGLDQILIFEDRDGDGRFETRKVFADKINLVSGLEVGFGGVWVGAAPHLLFIPDRDGDDRPDGPAQVLLDGWAFDDTHETLNSFIWGPDGWLYGNHGVFNESHVGKPGTAKRRRTTVSAAVWRYHPTRATFEVFAHGGSNQWGLDFDDSGQAFITTCRSRNGGGPVTHVAQGGYYWRQSGSHAYPHVYEPLLASADHDHGWGGAGGNDLVYGGHSHVGAMIYLGDNWPDRYRNQLFTHNLHGARINHEVNHRRGSGFVTQHADKDFLFTNDSWFVGVALKVGPDGAMYMIDWYDRQHCHHREVEKWDRSNGRMYKVAYGDAPVPRIDLAALRDGELVALQMHKNDWFVRTARRILQERAAAGRLSRDVAPALRKMLAESPEPSRRLRALWALNAIGGLDRGRATALLGDSESMVRAFAVQFLVDNRKASRSVLATFARMARGETDASVRLYLASALGRVPYAARWRIVEGLLAHGEDTGDQNLPGLIWTGFEPLFAVDRTRALRLADGSAIPKVRHFAYRRAALDRRGLDQVVARLDRITDVPEQRAAVLAVATALEGRSGVKPPRAFRRVGPVLQASPDEDIRHGVDVLAARFGDVETLTRLRATLGGPGSAVADRQRAFDILTVARDTATAPVLLDLVADPAFRLAAIKAVSHHAHPGTAAVLLRGYASFNNEEKDAALGTLVARPAWAGALLDAMAAGQFDKRDLTPVYARQIARLDDAKLIDRLNQVWGQSRRQSKDKAEVIAKYKALYQPASEWMYSAEHGRAVFAKACGACHRLFGEGGEIGPDLTGSPRRDLDYLLDNIVDPGALIGPDFQLTMIKTRDGQFLSGIVESRSDTTVTLKTMAERIVLARKDIEEIAPQDVSMMPEGLLEAFGDQDVQNLIRYLRAPAQVPLPPETPVAPVAAQAAAKP